MTTEAGITHWLRVTEEGALQTAATQDTTAIIEANKAKVLHNDGYTPSRELRRVASIPFILVAKWLNEEGWDAMDPANADRLVRKLNDPEYAHLRTAEGRLGISNGVIR